MPNKPSAAKALRQSEKRRLANKARMTEIKTLGKQIQRAVLNRQQDEAEGLLRRYVKRVDQAASCGMLHPNTAARRKSRMAHRLKATPAASVPV